MSHDNSVEVLESRVIQISAVNVAGNHRWEDHVQMYALCEDGTIWVKYWSRGDSNVPDSDKWYKV